jgi:hypothetical protein
LTSNEFSARDCPNGWKAWVSRYMKHRLGLLLESYTPI